MVINNKFRKIIFSFLLIAASFGVTSSFAMDAGSSSSFAIPSFEEAQKQFLNAVENGDLYAIEQLILRAKIIVLNSIRSKSSPKILDGKNNPRLVEMSESGIRNSLQQNINDLYVSKFLEFINAKSENDITALIWAADKCNTGIVTLLLSTAKEVFKDNPEMFFEFINAKSKKGVTALIAADKGNTETATLLLNTAKEVFKDNPEMFFEFINAKDENGVTALMFAADKGNTETATLLLNTAKEVFKDNPKMFLEFINARNHKGKTALIAAVDKGNTETATLLLNTAKEIFIDNPEMFFEFINAKDENGVTALTAAVTFGHKDILELLLNTAKELFKDNPKMFLEFIQKYLNHELNISKKNSVYLIKLILDISTEVFKNDSVLLSDFHGIIAEFLCK